MSRLAEAVRFGVVVNTDVLSVEQAADLVAKAASSWREVPLAERLVGGMSLERTHVGTRVT